MTFRFLALCAGLAAGALAQTPNPGPGGRRGPGRPKTAAVASEGHALRAYLNLTPAQMRDIQRASEQARRQAEEKTRAIEPQLRDKHAALDAAIAQGSDAAGIGKLVLEIRGLERQIQDAQRNLRDSFLNGLTAEQKVRFQAVEDAALLPQAAREAVRMGLVPGAQPPFQGPMQGPRQPAPRPRMMLRQPGPMPGQPQPPQPPQPPRPPDEE